MRFTRDEVIRNSNLLSYSLKKISVGCIKICVSFVAIDLIYYFILENKSFRKLVSPEIFSF